MERRLPDYACSDYAGPNFRDISGTVYVKVDAANLRSEPSTSSVVVDTLYYGEAVQTLATNDSWTKVKTKEGASGYLSNFLFQ